MLFCVLIVIVQLFLSPLLAADQCGNLNETQLYTPGRFTELDEYPWIGRVGYELNGKLEFRCTAVLINKRHAILPAHCVREEVLSVLFGDWQADNDINQPDCKTLQECAPPPLLYTIEELAVHPEYSSRRHYHDIAVAKLKNDVQFSKYVQPLCLPSASKPNEDYVGQRLELAGFSFPNMCTEGTMRRKVQAQISSLSHCANQFRSQRFQPTSDQMCGFVSGDCTLMSGAPLMGINVVNGKPSNFYLIGTVSFGTRVKRDDSPDVFTGIQTYRDWILRNSKI